MIIRVDVYADSIALSDVQPRPKLNRKCYDRFGLSHIPDITIQMVLSHDAEYFSISLPAEVSSQIPVLAACHEPNADNSNVPHPISFGEDGMAHYDSIASLARMAAVLVTGSGTVDLPASIWALLATLKILLEGESSIADVFPDVNDGDQEPCSAADVLQMAKYLGCESVADVARRHIRESLLAPACLTGEAGGGPPQAAICQRLAQLPDAEFTAAPRPPVQQPLLGGLGDALALPPCLKVKWLRADCLGALDVTRPGPAWTTAAWHSLAFCMHATPRLKELRVRLPCDHASPSGLSSYGTDISGSIGAVCGPAVDEVEAGSCSAARAAAGHSMTACGPGAGARTTSVKLEVDPTQKQCTYLWYSNGSTAGHLAMPPVPELSPKLPPTSIQPQQSAPDPRVHDSPPHSSSVRSHVSTAAIDTLAQLPTALPHLKLLELHHSQIAPSQTKALARALTFFSGSLQELKLDCWPCAALDADAAEREFKHESLNEVLLDGVCRLRELKVWSMPDWAVIVGDSIRSVHAEKLTVLRSLESVFVAGYPCVTCSGDGCSHFPAKMPFKSEQ